MLLTYFALLIIAFLGLFIGLLIGYLTKEELKPGFDYLNQLMFLILAAIIVIFFAKNWSILFVLLIAATMLAFSFSRHRETLYYYALAVIFFLSWRYNGFMLLAPLIFLYGLPLGSIYVHNHIKEKKEKVVLGALYKYAGFLINGIILGILGLLF
jgi:uncharacterized membrane protein YoaK (UPF0700 family)